jgi:hypothetical protein
MCKIFRPQEIRRGLQGFWLGPPVTPEVAGSSPVGPATFQFLNFLPTHCELRGRFPARVLRGLLIIAKTFCDPVMKAAHQSPSRQTRILGV